MVRWGLFLKKNYQLKSLENLHTKKTILQQLTPLPLRLNLKPPQPLLRDIPFVNHPVNILKMQPGMA